MVHIGPIYQLRSYSRESGRAGRDGKRSEAIILMSVGRQEALQKAHEQAQRRPVKFHISVTAKEKQRIEQQKVERFASGAACRRVYLDHKMDGRIERVMCEDGEGRCDVWQASDAMMDELTAQRQAYIQEGQIDPEKPHRMMDSTIDIPSSNIPFPSSPPAYSQSSTMNFDAGFATDQISPAERGEFQCQRMQRQQQRLQVHAHHQQEGHDVWDLENGLDMWVGKCRLC